jgi:hypothetical protein
VGFDDPPADRQPKPRAAAARRRRVGAEELLEHAALGAGGHARAAVGDLDDHPALARARGDLDRRAGGRVLQRVVDQVDQHLLDRDVVDPHQRQVGGKARGDRPAGQPAVEVAQRRAHDVVQRLPFPPQHQPARLQPRHVQQVVDQAVHPLGLGVDRVEHLGAGGGRRGVAGLDQRAGGAGDCGQRRAQVVRYAGQQRVAQELGFGAFPRQARLGGAGAVAVDQRADRQRGQEHDGERHEVLAIVHVERVVRRDEDQVERDHPEHRREDRGPAAVLRRHPQHAQQVEHQDVGVRDAEAVVERPAARGRQRDHGGGDQEALPVGDPGDRRPGAGGSGTGHGGVSDVGMNGHALIVRRQFCIKAGGGRIKETSISGPARPGAIEPPVWPGLASPSWIRPISRGRSVRRKTRGRSPRRWPC